MKRNSLFTTIALLPLLILSGCTDPIVDSLQSYSYSTEDGFILVTVYQDETTIISEYAIASFNITLITKNETYKQTPYVVVKTSDGLMYNLYDITLREFLVLSGESMGPWMMNLDSAKTKKDNQ